MGYGSLSEWSLILSKNTRIKDQGLRTTWQPETHFITINHSYSNQNKCKRHQTMTSDDGDYDEDAYVKMSCSQQQLPFQHITPIRGTAVDQAELM